MQLLTSFTLTIVVSSGVLNMMMSLVTILLTLRCPLTELDGRSSSSSVTLASEACLRGLAEGVAGALPPKPGE